MERTSCLVALKQSYYTISPIHNIYCSSGEQPSSALWYSRPGKHPLSAHPLSAHFRSRPGKAPTFRAPLYLARSPHIRRPQGFGNLPISQPGLGKFPTRQLVSSLWSPECLLPNSQLGRVSPYSYEASPPLSGLLYGIWPSETGPQITLYPTYIHSTTFPWCGSISFLFE